jgi:hypothetical protein
MLLSSTALAPVVWRCREMGSQSMSYPEHVVQATSLERSHDGMIPICHLEMSTDPPVYDSDADAPFAVDQLE